MSAVRSTVAVVSVLLCALVLWGATVILYDNLTVSIEDAEYVDGGILASFSTGSTAASLTDVKVTLVDWDLFEVVISGMPATAARASRASHQSRRGASSRSRAARGKGQPLRVGASVTIALYADSGTFPGTKLTTIGTLSDSALTGTPQVYDFPLGTPYALSARTRYWIGIYTTNESSAAWAWSYDISGAGVGSEYYFIGGEAVSHPNSDGPFLMRVTANTQTTPSGVPVPPSMVLMLTGLGGVGFYFARRKLAAAWK